MFYRDNRGLTLTPAGEMLLRHARIILRQVEHVKSDFLAEASDRRGHLRVFANTTAIADVLPEVLAAFMSDRPGVTVDVQERNTREVVRAIQTGAADIGIVSSGPISISGLDSRCFSTDRLVVATPPAHALSGRKRVAFAEAVSFLHVGLRESTLQEFLQEAADALNQRLEMRVLMGSFEAMCRMIGAGVGIGVLPETAARRHARGIELCIVELSDSWATRERRVVYRELEALPACAQAFVRTLLGHARNHDEAQP